MLGYISHTGNSVYYGDKAHWLDIDMTTPRPSSYHNPVVTDGAHTGWVIHLETLRAQRIADLKAEGLRRTQLIFPAIASFDFLQFVAEFWLSIAPAARTPTPQFQKAVDIYVAGKDAHTWLSDPLRTELELEGYNVVTGPAWPV